MNEYQIVKILMPAILSYAAYQSITHKEPVSEHTFTEAQIFKKLQPFLDKIEIRKDLKIKEKNTFFESIGSNSFQTASLVIYIARNFYAIDPGAASFTLKHEISHLKHDDRFTACFLALISTLAALALTSSCKEPLSANIASFTGCIVLFSYMYYREEKADDFAIKHSSIEELKGGRRLLKAIQQRYLELRTKTLWGKWLISPAGESQIDFRHPSLTSRIKKIENRLTIQQATLLEYHEQEKIEKIKKFFQKL